MDNFGKSTFLLNNQQASREHTLDISQSFSATHYKGRSAFQNHFGYLQTTMPGVTGPLSEGFTLRKFFSLNPTRGS
ncbi:hypothetical protein Scep_016861 [Stephania cephalantha]|uniref:Uncharacterized protein n=1 Tax=Stephania cephalantha TaxID=152367 RepID=A0AAP0INH7_9MAGN